MRYRRSILARLTSGSGLSGLRYGADYNRTNTRALKSTLRSAAQGVNEDASYAGVNAMSIHIVRGMREVACPRVRWDDEQFALVQGRVARLTRHPVKRQYRCHAARSTRIKERDGEDVRRGHHRRWT